MKITVIVLLIIIISSSVEAQYLNPGDGVRITFFNITDQISGDYYIQQDGKVQLPYVGLISTEKKAYPEIKAEITLKYDSLYRNPELTVQPLYKINILGEVKSPGYYYVTDVEKMTGIFALAGGVTGDADLDNVYIIRDDKEIELDAQNLIETGRTVSDIGLQSGDRIFVPRTWWANARSVTIIVSVVSALVAVAVLFLK
ncbi:MAG TPA: polysaccharide biosynthesis/export family protein [Ignavibacteriaceae bacterium]|nr:polysaccharide biosynthesis/export family protein [Ignavibacteriaceae bacterium]